MKTKLILFCAALACASLSVFSQTPQDILKGKLEIYYVADVTSTNAERLDNNAVASGTFSGPFWSNAGMLGAQRLVKGLLASASNGGDARLQRIASEIIRIRNEKVKVYLLNDATASITSATQTNFGACDNGAGKSWPCARSYDDANAMAGQMCLGTNFLSTYMPSTRNSSNIREYRYGTFLHELTHTQDNVEWRAHMHWDGQWYSYGADGDHYTMEVLPDLNATYSEAIANAFGMYYDTYDYRDGFEWFAQGGYMLVEHAPAGYNGPAITSLLTAFQNAGVNPVGSPRTIRGGTYSVYRMPTVPLSLIMNNEIILAIMLESVRNYGGTDRYMDALKSSNGELFRVCANPVAVMFRNMCRMGLPSGINDISQLNVSTGNAAYVFPLALADFFTGYQAQSKAQFKQIFENQGYMDGWIDAYWDNHRHVVMQEAPLASGLGDLVVRIKHALGMS